MAFSLNSLWKKKGGGKRMPFLSLLLHPSKQTALAGGLGVVGALAIAILAWDAYLFFFSISPRTPSPADAPFRDTVSAAAIDEAISFIREEEEKVSALTASLPTPIPETAATSTGSSVMPEAGREQPPEP
jgi:hypothetical protein